MRRRARALVGTAVVAAIALLCGSVATPNLTNASAAPTATAVVVIDTGSSVRASVIHFDGSVTGIEALRLAGANPQTAGFSGEGAAVCELDGVGNPIGSCLVGPHSEYWAYWLARGGATSWSYSRGCACTVTVHDGDVEGWRYGTGQQPRSSASFCGYAGSCAPPPTDPAPSGGGPPVGAPPSGDSAGGSGNGDGAGGGGNAGSGTNVFSPSITASDGDGTSDSGSATSPDAVTSGPTTSTSASGATPTDARKTSGDDRAAALGAPKDGDSGSGSPVGVVVVAGVLVLGAAATVVLRRRGRGSANAAP